MGCASALQTIEVDVLQINELKLVVEFQSKMRALEAIIKPALENRDEPRYRVVRYTKIHFMRFGTPLYKLFNSFDYRQSTRV